MTIFPPSDLEEETETYVEPTTDQLEVKVTYDLPTAVLAQFDENSVGAALIKRLSQTTNAIDDNTKFVLLDDSKARTLSEDDFYPLALIYLNGGYIALQRPTLGVVLAFVLGLEGKAGEIQDEVLKDMGVEMPEGALADTRSLEDSQLVRKVNNARALTRADADQVINSMLSRTNEFTVPGHLMANDDQGRSFGRANVSNTTIRSWSVYDFGSNRDFYYVEENHHIRMGGQDSNKGNTLYWGPYKKEDWMSSKYPNTNTIKQFYLEGKNDRTYVYFYGNWLSESTHAMELEGNGEIQLEKSLPSTDNSQTTEIIAIGSTDGTSNTSGWSIGFNVGGNAGASGSNMTGGGNLGFNFSYTDTHTTSHSTSFTMSTSHVSKDLAIVKNTHGNEVTWTYKEGHTPGMIWDKGWHEMAADILTNDIDIENKVCWSVKKPSGSYTLSWYLRDYTKARYLNFQ